MATYAAERGISTATRWKKTVTWEDVVDFITGNFLELDREEFLDEERLRDNAGFLVGWISGMSIPR